MPTDPTPHRSDDELLALVHEKANRLQRQRAFKALGAATLAVLLIAGGIALARDESGPGRTIRAAGDPTTTSGDPAETTTTESTPTTVVPPPPTTIATTTTRPPPPGRWRTTDSGGNIDVTMTPAQPAAGELATLTIRVHRTHGESGTPAVSWGDGRTSQDAGYFCDVATIGPDGKRHYWPKDPNAPPTESTYEYPHAYRSGGLHTIDISVSTECESSADTKSTGVVNVRPGPKRSNGPQQPFVSVLLNVHDEPNSMTAHVSVSGFDEDGFVSRLVLDWGDGTPPSVKTFGACVDDGRGWPRRSDGKDLAGTEFEFSHAYTKAGEYTYKAEMTSSGCTGGDPQHAGSNPQRLPMPLNPQPASSPPPS